MLAIFETHPVQYHAPVYRQVAEMGVNLEVVYGSDFSVRGYKDKEFGASFAWDKELTAGTKYRFLETEAESYEKVTGKGIGQALDEIRPQAALLCGYNHPFDKAALQECRKRGIPILLRAETTDHAVRRGWLKSRIRDWRLRVIYRECAVLLPIGKRSREHYRRLGVPEEKMVDSPYCVDEASFLWDESSRARLRAEQRTRMGIGDRGEGIEGGTKWILFSGKLVWRKGPDLLVEAAGRLRKEGMDVGVVFCGSGEMETQLKKRCEELRVSAVFLGFVNQSGLSAVYHACDLFCLPSREGETWGLVVNEALLHGLPVVVSEAVGCAPDLIENTNNGVIVKSNSLNGLLLGIKKELNSLTIEKNLNHFVTLKEFNKTKAAVGIAEALKKIT